MATIRFGHEMMAMASPYRSSKMSLGLHHLNNWTMVEDA